MKKKLFREEALEYFSRQEELEPPFKAVKYIYWIPVSASILLILTLVIMFLRIR